MQLFRPPRCAGIADAAADHVRGLRTDPPHAGHAAHDRPGDDESRHECRARPISNGWNKLYGLDKPWYQAYFVWLGNVVRGRSGPLDSAKQSSRSSQLIVERMPATLMLSVTSLVLTYLLSIPIGLWATVRSGTFASAP